MSIWTQLEADALRDRRNLDTAMQYLRTLASTREVNPWILERIAELEADVHASRLRDHRFNPNCVPYNIAEQENKKPDEPDDCVFGRYSGKSIAVGEDSPRR